MPGPIRVLELRSVRGTGGGPEKTILLGAARSDPARVRVTVAYIRDARDEVFAIDRRAAAAGVDYVEVRERHSFDPGICPALRRLVCDRQIDIVHAHEYKTDLIALLLAAATRTVPMATVHGWTGRSRRERLLYYPADKRLLRWFPRVVTVSEDIRREVLRHGARPGNVTTVLNGIDHRQFRRVQAREAEARAEVGLNGQHFVIGAVGRLAHQKRFDLLLTAFGEVRRRHPHAVLLVAGDGPEREPLIRLASRLGLSGACRFLGQRSDIVGLHHAFDLFVQSSEYEGTPNAVLEAMALETPVVATASGGTGELFDDGVHGRLVPAGDAAALARAMDEAIADPQGARRRARAARLQVERELSFDVRMQKVQRIYEELLETRKAAPAGGRRQSRGGTAACACAVSREP